MKVVGYFDFVLVAHVSAWIEILTCVLQKQIKSKINKSAADFFKRSLLLVKHNIDCLFTCRTRLGSNSMICFHTCSSLLAQRVLVCL